jgi:hypothetical protein
VLHRVQVLGLWDSLSCAAVLRLVRAVTAAAPFGARAPAAAADAADVDGQDDAGAAADAEPEPAAADAGGACEAQARLAAVLRGLARLLRVWPLSAQPDALRSIAETLAEAAVLPQATGARRAVRLQDAPQLRTSAAGCSRGQLAALSRADRDTPVRQPVDLA